MSAEMRCCGDSTRGDLAALMLRAAVPVPPSRGIPERQRHTSPFSTSPAGARARPPAHRLGVVLEHLPGLLLAAQLLDAFPLQVALLGLLEDLVCAALPGPQELRRLARPQHHGYRDASGRTARGGAGRGRERRESGGTLSTRGPARCVLLAAGPGMQRRAGAHGVGAHGPGWHAGTGVALAPGWRGLSEGVSRSAPARYSLCADSEASRSSSSAVPRAAAGPGGGGMARPGTGDRDRGREPGGQPGARAVRVPGRPWRAAGAAGRWLRSSCEAALKVTSRRRQRRRRQHLGLAAGLGGGAEARVAGAGRAAGGRTGLGAAPGGRGR